MALQANSTDVYRGDVLVEAPALPKGPKASLTLRREARLAYTILTPTLLVILFVVAYPFCTAIYMSMQDKMVGAPGRFVGLSNYAELFRDEVFLRTAWNSVVYTVVAVALKFLVGLTMALILDQERRFNNFFRTLLFLPWAVPVVIVSPELALDLRRPERLSQQLPDHVPHHARHHLVALAIPAGHGVRDRRRRLGRAPRSTR